MKRLPQFFEDGDGNLSATRLAFIFVIHIVVIVWAFCCIKEGKMVQFDLNTVYLVLTLMAGKVGQSFAENKNPIEPPKI